MKIVVATKGTEQKDKERRSKFETDLKALGHIVMSICNPAQLNNLLRAGYQIDCIVTDHQLEGWEGTEIIAKVGHYTPTLVFSAKSKFVNYILKKGRFPNTTFAQNETDPRKNWGVLIDWLANVELPNLKKTKRA